MERIDKPTIYIEDADIDELVTVYKLIHNLLLKYSENLDTTIMEEDIFWLAQDVGSAESNGDEQKYIAEFLDFHNANVIFEN